MNLRRKLLAGYGVMLGLLLLLGAAALFSLHNLNEDLDRATRITARKQFLAGGVNAAASEMTSLARGSVLASVVGDKPHSDSYQQQFRIPQQRLQDSVA
jgi:CHASE3 domain sensor protein